MNVKNQILTEVTKVASTILDPLPSYKIEHPADPGHGDYSINVAFVIAKELKKNPREIAEEIVKKFRIQDSRFAARRAEFRIVEKVEVVGGFINFWLSEKYLIDVLRDVLNKKDSFGGSLAMRGKKIMVEYTDPNPFKEFHIGHLYSNAVGESLSRLFEAEGAEVKRANYQGDVGMHVAKAIFGLSLVIPNLFRDPNEMLNQVQHDTLKQKVKFLGECYAKGSKVYEEDEEAKKIVNKLNKQIYELDPEIKEIYLKGRQWSLEYFETIYQRLGTKFDYYYFEREVGEVGLKLVREYLGKGVFEESQGAVIFPGKKYGLHNRVFINSLGLPTYEAKELGLNSRKYQEYPFDISIIVTGNEINEYFKVLFAAMEKVIPQVANKTKHIGHGMVRLPEGKMSSRTGKILTGEWLLDEVKSQLSKSFQDMSPDVLEIVTVGAVKYALLRSGIGRDIEFSFEESISFEGNSGPYLQYTYVRTQSVLTKIVHPELVSGSPTREKGMPKQVRHDINNEEEALLRLLYRFPEIVEDAVRHYAPNYIASFLFEVAAAFNLFYQKHKILPSSVIASDPPAGGERGNLSNQKDLPSGKVGIASSQASRNDKLSNDTMWLRILLTASVGQILYNGLYLLGIQAPDRM